MSLPVPLSVRLSTTLRDRHITADLRDLSFREIATGGFASASFSLDAPLNLTPEEIGPYAPVYIYDSRNGNTVWEGRLEDPGRAAGREGQVYDLAAVGPSGHTRDRTVPLVYVDRRLDQYIRVENVTPGGTFGTGTDPGLSGTSTPVDQSLLFQFPQGLSVVTNSRIVARYDGLRLAGQKLARYDYVWDAGVTSPSLSVQATTRTDGGTGETARSQTASTAGGASSPRLIVTDFLTTRNTLDLRLVYTGAAGTFTGDDIWAAINNTIVVATRFNKAGTELLTAADYPNSTVLASEVFADLLGRGLLPRFDGANATIDATSFPIEQLVYEDGVSPEKVISDLLLFEPSFRWGAYESDRVTGKHRVEFVAWPTTVRYEAEILDGYTGPGSSEGLFDQVTVRWKDSGGVVRTTTRTASVAALTAAGLIRTGFLDLGNDVGGTLVNAQRAGDQWLIDHGVAPNQGRLVVARPILDLLTGRMVMPWEIRAGQLIRVRGVQPRLDALNATTRDGVTVFRIASREYRVSDAAATLELDSYSRSVARSLAQLTARPVFRRR